MVDSKSPKGKTQNEKLAEKVCDYIQKEMAITGAPRCWKLWYLLNEAAGMLYAKHSDEIGKLFERIEPSLKQQLRTRRLAAVKVSMRLFAKHFRGSHVAEVPADLCETEEACDFLPVSGHPTAGVLIVGEDAENHPFLLAHDAKRAGRIMSGRKNATVEFAAQRDGGLLSEQHHGVLETAVAGVLLESPCKPSKGDNDKPAAQVFEDYVRQYEYCDDEEMYDDTYRDVQFDFQHPGENFAKHHPAWEVIQRPQLTHCEKYTVRAETVLRHKATGVMYLIASYQVPYGLSGDGEAERNALELDGDQWFEECEMVGMAPVFKAKE